MPAEVAELTGTIRDVSVRLVSVNVEGHTVEQVLSYDVAEAEAVYGQLFDDELDEHIRLGLHAGVRLGAGILAKLAFATSYVLDGKCIRTAKIEHCSELKPAVAYVGEPDLSGCIPGTQQISHQHLHESLA